MRRILGFLLGGALVAARALIPIDGEKVVVFLGWGLGRFGSTGVEMIPD